MVLRLQVRLKGIDSYLNNLKKYQKNIYVGNYIYPVFKKQLTDIDISMKELTEYLISYSLGDFVKEGINNLEDFTDEGFQKAIIDVLYKWGQNPKLTPSPLYQRWKLKVGSTPRNIITGEYISCFGLGFSKIEPSDIPIDWIRKL